MMEVEWSEWWDKWQLRILVLFSLGLRWFLVVATPLRKYVIPRWLRACNRLAYIGSDALAIYALAILFNRHPTKASSSCNGGGILEILWAPLLLIHLGGQRELTSVYNMIEDNELWVRHTVTLLSQVVVALYSFYKLWPSSGGDRRLWASAMLLFIIGVLSFSENKLFAAGEPKVEDKEEEEEDNSIIMCWRRKKKRNMEDKLESAVNKLVHMRLSDMSLYAAVSDLQQYPDTFVLETSASLVIDERKEWGREINFSKISLRQAFGVIDTRGNVVWTTAYVTYHLLLLPALYVAAVALFAASDKRVGRYSATDVKTTYVLLCFTAALDVLGVFVAELMHWLMMDVAGVPALCERVAQYNLIDAVLRKVKLPAAGRRLIKSATRFGCHDDQRYILFKRGKLYDKEVGRYIIDDLILKHDDMDKVDLSSYRNFDMMEVEEEVEEEGEIKTKKKTKIDPKNNWVLGKLVDNENRRYQTEVQDAFRRGTRVRESLNASFNRSVLIWHLATDLCLCLCLDTPTPTGPVNPRELRTEAISNYMAHLLNFRPDMLMAGAGSRRRRNLFTDAMREIESILSQGLPRDRHFKHPLTIHDDMILAKTIYEHGLESYDYPLVEEACRLAEELRGLKHDIRWELMHRLWVGMLFYSAAMGKAYLHAKSLSEGGEFLSFIWLLLSITGCKTLSDKLQMPED